MVMDFSVVSIEPSLLDNAIVVYFSKDVDPDSVSPDNIFVVVHDNRAAVPFDIKVDDDYVKIISKTGFEPNTSYTLLLQAGISDLVGKELPDPIMRTVTFGGDVTNIVRIAEPVDFEIVHEIALKWAEYDKDGKNIAQEDISDVFEIQIARENAFYNVICSTITTSGDLDIVLMEPIEDGQYYFRIRARNGEQFGRWSNTGTFIFKKLEEKPETEPVSEPSEEDESTEEEPKPERTDDGITIIDYSSTKGILEKPSYRAATEVEDICFQFTFDEPIDISSMNIVVRRSDV